MVTSRRAKPIALLSRDLFSQSSSESAAGETLARKCSESSLYPVPLSPSRRCCITWILFDAGVPTSRRKSRDVYCYIVITRSKEEIFL